MNIATVLGKKLEQTQAFLKDGTRVPLTRVWVGENAISQVKNIDKDGYMAVQIGFGEKNKISKPLAGHLKKAGIKKNSRFLREVRVDDADGFEPGAVIAIDEVLKAGDKVDVVGVSKGKGFAGVVKRWGFRGGPKTHGQSDRHRAPGSIGQSATPGRVYKGKKMAGRMGQDRVTIKNLEVIEIKDDEVFIKGLVPGPIGGLIMITKVGENKNFIPLYSVEPVEEETKEEAADEVKEEQVTVEATQDVQPESKSDAEAKDVREDGSEEAVKEAKEKPEEKVESNVNDEKKGENENKEELKEESK